MLIINHATLVLGLALLSSSTPALIAEPATVSEKIVTGLVRTSTLPLNGTWRFREDPQNAGDAEGWFNPGSVKGRDVMVPLPWQLASDELREYLGTAWYERDFHLAKEYQNRRIAVHFLGVDHWVKVVGEWTSRG